MPIHSLLEHKNGIFVRFWPSGPPFSGFSSTKSGFLCFFGLRNPRFRAFRAQNRGFCALLAVRTPIFGRFEHKIGVFVLFGASKLSFSGISSTKSRFLCAFGQYFLGFRPRRAQNRDFCALFPEKVGSAGRGNLVGASAERGNLVAASARRGNLFSAPAWSCNLIAARTASRFAERSCRLSSRLD